MPDQQVAESLLAAASDVLETMFFSSVLTEAPVGTAPEGSIAARLRFSGARCGFFAIRLTEGAAKVIAANFLAEESDEPSAAQVQEVIAELANMMCGSVLSRLDRGAHFDLGAPAIVDPAEVAVPGAEARAFDIGDGEVAIFLQMESRT